jgi:phage shock protein A
VFACELSIPPLEEDSREAGRTAEEWSAKAAAAAKKGQELRAGGNAAEADKFDNLTRVALKRQIDFEYEVKQLAPTIAQQTEIVDRLKGGLENMKGKLGELRCKRDELAAVAGAAPDRAFGRQVGALPCSGWPSSRGGSPSRKVRTSQGWVVGNADPGKPAGQCHRKHTAHVRDGHVTGRQG